jgi:transposase
MFCLTSAMQYYLYSYPTDMRRSFYTLSGMVTNMMARNVQDGDVYIFINRPCTSMKILHMECGGLVIYHMKLESGCFNLPVFDQSTHTFQTSWQDLMMMVQGVTKGENVKKKRRKNL